MLFYFYAYVLLCTYFISVRGWNYLNLNYSYPQNVDQIIIELEVSLFDQCYRKINGPTVVVGNWKIYEPMYLLEYNKEDLKTPLSPAERYFKLKEMKQMPLTAAKFFIETLSVESLEITISVLKDSLYWNLHGYYVVKNFSNLDTCQFAYSVFKIFWNFKILNVIYVCYTSDGVTLYTYNPYNEVAPKNWKKIKKFVEENDDTLTLFQMLPNTSEFASMCKEITYDKAHNLSSYPVKVADLWHSVEVLDIPKTRTVKNIFDNLLKFFHIIWEKLGATISVKNITAAEFGTIDSNGSFTETLKDVIEGTLEARSVPDFQRAWQYESYIQKIDGVCYITKKHSFSIIGQLASALDLEMCLMLFLFFAIVSIIFVYVLKADWVDAVLEVLRASVGVSTIRAPSGIVKNLAFIWIIYVLILINVFLQSLLSAIAATATTRPVKIESYEDIMLNNYRVYSPLFFVQYFEDTPLSGKVILMPDIRGCFDFLKTDENVACVQSCDLSKYFLTEDRHIQISPDVFLRNYATYFFREDSPIKRRFQWLCNLLAENGILHYLSFIKQAYFFKRPSSQENDQITLYQMRYIFYIVFIVYSISFIIFLIEMAAAV